MKKILLSAAVMLFGATLAYAQNVCVPENTQEQASVMRLERNEAALPSPKTSMKTLTAATRAVGADQKYMGPYDTDDLADTSKGLGMPGYPGNYSVGAIIKPEVLKQFDGFKIVGMRFGLCQEVGSSRVFAAKVTNGTTIGSDVISQSVSSTVAGWNEVTLETPYTIEANGSNTLLIGFDYKQVSKNSGGSKAYPLSLAGTGYDGSFYMYDGEEWNNFGSSYGCISVQCLVEKEGLSKIIDVVMDEVSIASLVKKGEKAKVSWVCHNLGSTSVENCSFGLSIDGNALCTFSGVTVASSSQTFSSEIDIPSDLTTGKECNLTVALKSIDGAAPGGDTSNDQVSCTFRPYAEAVERQMQLIENTTGTWCTYCPYGAAGLTALEKKRDDIAWVALHSSDTYSISAANTILNLLSCGSIPAASINRYSVDGNYLSFSLGYSNSDYLANLLSSYIDKIEALCPTFAKIDLETDFSSDSRTLNITVKGTGVEAASTFLSDDKLTVYLTENGVIGQQNNLGTEVSNYEHHYVLRKVVSASAGDDIVWDGDNFEKTYSVLLNNSWDVDNMNVVAFVGKSFYDANGKTKTDLYDLWVNNTNMVKVGQTTTAINGVSADTDVYETARYAVDGKKLSAPAPGINIVKMSDGSTRKVLVK